MPEEDVIIEKDDGGIEIEVVSEEEKPRLKSGDTRSLDVRDDELKNYGRDVQDRIKKLRFAYHEERRLKEQAQRDSSTASEVAQRLFKENNELKRNVQRGEQAVIHQAISRTDAEIQRAKQDAKVAHEQGQIDDFLTSNEKMARAVAERERLNLLKEDPGTVETEEPAVRQPQAQAQPEPDERTKQWFARNPWWQKPGHERRTGYALGVHNELAARGITPRDRPDEYWKTIDEELAKFGGNGNGSSSNGHDPDDEPRNTRPLAVAGGTRSAGTANAGRTRTVRLNESQVRLAHRLGLTTEQYAAQLLLEESRNG
jgi:hypothetical protein